MCDAAMNQRGSYAPIGITDASKGPSRLPISWKAETYPESPPKWIRKPDFARGSSAHDDHSRVFVLHGVRRVQCRQGVAVTVYSRPGSPAVSHQSSSTIRRTPSLANQLR